MIHAVFQPEPDGGPPPSSGADHGGCMRVYSIGAGVSFVGTAGVRTPRPFVFSLLPGSCRSIRPSTCAENEKRVGNRGPASMIV